jgi:hypothetical protein
MTIATLHEKAATEQAVRDEVEIRAIVDLIHKAHHDKNGGDRRSLSAKRRGLQSGPAARETDPAKLHGMGLKALDILREELKQRDKPFRR